MIEVFKDSEDHEEFELSIPCKFCEINSRLVSVVLLQSSTSDFFGSILDYVLRQL
jgi:hypothetical protein